MSNREYEMGSVVEQSSYLYGTNATYVAEIYEKYLKDPTSVDQSWVDIFKDLSDDAATVNSHQEGASWSAGTSRVVGADQQEEGGLPNAALQAMPQIAMMPGMMSSNAQIRRATTDSIQALMLIRAYRVRGHLHADLDPLGLENRAEHPELDYTVYGFSEADLDRPIFINYVLGLETATLRQIIDICKQTYCSNIGIEFMHIQDPVQKSWIQERIEGGRNQTDFTVRGRTAIMERLLQAECFEQFLDKKYTGTKRFGLDGGESLIPALEQIIKRGGQLGVEEIVLGMAHRGRLNVLTNVMGKRLAAIFSEFQGASANPDDVQGSGDVKYHLGTSADRIFDGHTVHLSLTANPSHLEIVDPVVLGKVRAKQHQRNDTEGNKVVGLLLHGDAAFAGQGVVAECFDMSQLKGYRTGGTIHVIINNQIGFTTAPSYSRSSPYCSDVAKQVSAPIIHVNADDPEAVVHAARLAIEFRQRFKWDVVLDMICYRRYGHNEGEEPGFTQPLMYRTISKHPSICTLYSKYLVEQGVLTENQYQEMRSRVTGILDEEFEASKTYKPNKADWLEGKWSGLNLAGNDARRGKTSVSMELLREVGKGLTEVPQNFNIHSKIKRQLKAKQKAFESGQGIDWATAEALAYGTLLTESTAIRLSGQDSGRGTFSQRHSVWIDQESEDRYIPLNHIRYGQAPFIVIDSPLSEAGVLGFEYGYSLAEPQMLVLWEAQFGDFVNGAQVVIDQFISSGEHKWLRMCGLVMLLPHGYEGQGPEHSSARPERFLQLCAEDNIQVVNCTTPANYFHVLRRQMRRDFRKPLIILTPKSLLRHKRCVSNLSEMSNGSTFHRVLWDNGDRQLENTLAADDQIKRVVLCTGKVYYDLLEEREKRQQNDVYLMRVEQLYPYPDEVLQEELARFPNADIVWCQEEPENQGYWHFIRWRIEDSLAAISHKTQRVKYAGRSEGAAPATGLMKRHLEQQANLVNTALTL